jgi:hypothetical protein
MQELMSKHSAMAKNKIKLDVGGQLFTTSKETLLKFEGSFFFAMLSSGRWEPDEDGTYFIDRSPTYFSYVIDYLRTGSSDILVGLSRLELDRVYTEFDFYQIGFPRPSTPEWDTSIDAAHLAFTGADTSTATHKIGGDHWNATAVSSQDVDWFRMKIEYRSSGYVMVGFQVYPAGFLPLGANYYGDTSYYLCIRDGTLWGSGKICESFHGSKLKTGSIITGIYDREAHTISFGVDDSAPKVAFPNVQASGLRAICQFGETGASATLC